MTENEAMVVISRIVNCHTESIDDWETDEEREAEIEHISQAMDIIYEGLGKDKKLLVECAEHLETVCSIADDEWDCPTHYRTKCFNPSVEKAYKFLYKIRKVLKVEDDGLHGK